MRRPSTPVAATLLAVALLGSSARLARGDALDTLNLPPVPKQPWRFSHFPILAWWGPPGTATLADFQAYKDAGFTLHATNPDTGYDQAFAYVKQVGLSSMTFLQPQGFELPPLSSFNPPVSDSAMAGFLIGDEPQSGAPMVADITTVNQQMRADPTRWTLFNMLPPNLQVPPGTSKAIAAAARNGMPIVSYDDYVILDDGSDMTAQFYTNLSTVRAATLAANVPFWAFAVTVRHEGYLGFYRSPSESDLRWMQFSNLAYGAKGLWYFTYWGATTLPNFASSAIVTNTGAKTELYTEVQALNQTVLAAGDTLLGLTSVDVMHTIPPSGQKSFAPGTMWIADLQAKDALIGSFTDAAGTPYALVVNKLHGKGMSAASTADTIVITLDPSVSGVEAVSWLDGQIGPLSIANGQTSLTIAGGTGVLLKATLAPPGDPDAGADGGSTGGPPPTSTSQGGGCTIASDGAGGGWGCLWVLTSIVGAIRAPRRKTSVRRKNGAARAPACVARLDDARGEQVVTRFPLAVRAGVVESF